MSNIESRIDERSYQSPGRARAAIANAGIKGSLRTRLLEKIDAWEAEESVDAVVGGVPQGSFEPATRVLPTPAVRLLPPTAALESPITVNLNARVRARLTPYGVSLLYAARDKVAVPDNLMENRGVWETSLWQFVSVMGEHLTLGDDAVTVDSNVELLSLVP